MIRYYNNETIIYFACIHPSGKLQKLFALFPTWPGCLQILFDFPVIFLKFFKDLRQLCLLLHAIKSQPV